MPRAAAFNSVPKRVRRIAAVAILLSLVPLACRRPHHPALPAGTQPATRAATGSPTYSNDSLGVSLSYPPTWSVKPNADYVWMIVPPKAATGDDVSLEVPKLPPHIPGMIPLKMVKNGYVDDLKTAKQAFATTTTDATVSGARAFLVHSTWTEKGAGQFETALLMVHGDHVFILRAEGAAASEPLLTSTFDDVKQSIKWLK